MSHFSRIRTRLTDKDLVLQALTALGFIWEEGHFNLRTVLGDQERVSVRIQGPRNMPIGLRETGTGFEIIADWSMISGLTQTEFQNRLTQKYAYLATRREMEKQGFTLVEETNAEDGRIHLTLRRQR